MELILKDDKGKIIFSHNIDTDITEMWTPEKEEEHPEMWESADEEELKDNPNLIETENIRSESGIPHIHKGYYIDISLSVMQSFPNCLAEDDEIKIRVFKDPNTGDFKYMEFLDPDPEEDEDI